jgi:IBR domain, a half RING-finger domain
MKLSHWPYKSSSAVATPSSGPIAKVDVPYLARDLPLTFFGVKHSRWTKEDLVTIIETLGGVADTKTTRIELYQTIQRRYKPHRVSQRAINTLEELAQAATAQGEKSQKQVRDAAQAATLERAELAREKRAAAKGKRTKPAEPEPAPLQQKRRPRTRVVKGAEDEDSESEEDEADSDEDESQDSQAQPPNPQIGVSRQRGRLEDGLNPTFGGEASGLLRRNTAQITFGDLHRVRGSRRMQPTSTPEKHIAKRRKTSATAVGTTNPRGPPSVVFGTSIAIQDTAVFRRRLELAEFSAPTNELSCQICSDDLDPLFPFQVSVAAQCNHTPEICLNCWEQHIAAQVDSKTWDAITCPHAYCNAILGHHDMQRFAPAEVYSRYDSFQTNQDLKNMPGYRPCAHEGCGSGAVVEPDTTATYMTCHDCKRNTCLNCNHIYHDNQTCDEYRASLANARGLDKERRARAKLLKRFQERSEKYLDKNAKTCPNAACGVKIQKTQGCDHMICKSLLSTLRTISTFCFRIVLSTRISCPPLLTHLQPTDMTFLGHRSNLSTTILLALPRRLRHHPPRGAPPPSADLSTLPSRTTWDCMGHFQAASSGYQAPRAA